MASLKLFATKITRRHGGGICRRQPLDLGADAHSIKVHDGPDNVEIGLRHGNATWAAKIVEFPAQQQFVKDPEIGRMAILPRTNLWIFSHDGLVP
jgi:hypothetical protein